MKYTVSLLLAVQIVFAQNKMKPEETEVWEPEPPVVQPGIHNAPPSDAIVLFDGSDFSKWRNESIKAYGNAIVPQVALQIFKTIEQYEIQTNSNTG